MAKLKKDLLRAVALCLVACLCFSMVACHNQGGEDPTGDTGTNSTNATNGTTGEDITYTIELKTQSGNPLSGVGVYVYTDSTKEELVWFARTDDAGKISFTDAASDSYIAVLGNVPIGYIVEESYALTGAATVIELAADIVSDDELKDITYKLGDEMLDFSVTTPDGTVYTLSELLKTKKAVALNFWYTQCQPCKMEFPYLQEAYEKYSGDIEILAMNPVEANDAAIDAFQKDLGLTFPMAQCSSNWEKAMQLAAYPTTVIIDRSGVISLIHEGSITEAKTFEDAFAFFTSDDYVPTVVEDIADLEVKEEEEKEEEGTIDNPTEIGGVDRFDITCAPGQEVFCDVYKISNMYMQINSPNAYLIYNGTTYYPNSNGVIGLVVSCPDNYTPMNLGFGNTGDETETFHVTFSALAGTLGNPYSMQLGEFTVNTAAGNDQGVYYTYVATETGTITVECLSASVEEYGFTLYNLNTYAFRNLDQDRNETASNPAVSIAVNEGDVLQFSAAALRTSSNIIPAGSFKFRASFEASDGSNVEQEVQKYTYTVTVTDEAGQPLSGVTVWFMQDGTTVSAATNDSGVATTSQVAGTYTVTVTVPAGYTVSGDTYSVSNSAPSTTVQLEKKVEIVNLDYTVKVVDANGTPIFGAMVAVGNNFAMTDANGTAVFNLQKGSYVVFISAMGYVADPTYAFDGEATELTVTLMLESAVNPTEPSVNPTEPSVNPTEPSVNPTEPSLNPTEPSVNPTEPSVNPTEPSVNPTEPSVNPTEPSVNPTEPSTEPTAPAKITYSVTVTDAFDNPQTNVVVQFLKNNVPVTMVQVNANGTATVALDPGDYTANLMFFGTALYYDKTATTLSADKPSTKIMVAAELGEPLDGNLDGVGNDDGVYISDYQYPLALGGNHIQLGADQVNFGEGKYCFFLIRITEPGTYSISVNTDAPLSYWGSNPNFIFNQTPAGGYENNTVTLSVSEGNLSGGNVMTAILGVEVVAGITDSILVVSRLGDPQFDISDAAWSEWQTGPDPTSYKHNGKALTYVDLAADSINLVYNEADGYYHLNSANGPVILVNLSATAPYYSLDVIINGDPTTGAGGAAFRRYFYNEDGSFQRKEDYTDSMCKYIDSCDPDYGVTPLTKDLAYMLQNGGEQYGWWDATSEYYAFAGMNPDLVWMFACCYAQ